MVELGSLNSCSGPCGGEVQHCSFELLALDVRSGEFGRGAVERSQLLRGESGVGTRAVTV